MKLVFAFLLVLGFSSVQAQKVYYKANKQFQLKKYHKAIENYKLALQKNPTNLEAKSNLAECYRMTNQLVLAQRQYSTIMPEEFVNPQHIKNYGITLMKMAKYPEAREQFEIYKVYEPQDAEHYQMMCDFAYQIYKDQSQYELELLDVNSEFSDFGVTFLNNDIIFSTFRDEFSNVGDEEKGNVLATAALTPDLKAEGIKSLRSEIADKKNIGPISYSTNAELVAFSRNKITDGGVHVSTDDAQLAIYIAELEENGDWSNETPFKYNEFGVSTGFPCLAFNGKALYFSSNRVGTLGGYDLFVSYLKDGKWSYPENLGPEINSPGDEITPFYNGDELYFASNYHHGMGGYDLFKSTVVAGNWSSPQNLGNGINSPGDDYYPAMKPNTNGLFFSSNRLGGRGNDDIYLAMPANKQELFTYNDAMPQAVSLTDLATVTTKGAVETSTSVSTVSNIATAPRTKVEPKVETKPTYATRDTPADELPTWGAPIKTTVKRVEPTPTEPVVAVEELEETLAVEETTIPAIEETDQITDVQEVRDLISLAALDYTTVNIERATPTITASLSISAFATQRFYHLDEEIEEEVVVQTTEKVQILDEPIVTTTTPAETTEDTVPTTARIADMAAVNTTKAPFNVNLAGAKKVAFNEILPNSKVYFIQLASLSRLNGNINEFKHLAKYGNLYKTYAGAMTKIKLGYFYSRTEANKILRNVKSRGYADAFITADDLNSTSLELFINNQNVENTTTTSNYSGKSNYKIRLASYEDPIWFDINKAKELGHVEQWTKNGWTIFILSGYKDYNDAEKARIQAVNKGFADAEIVIDNDGILERIRKY